jgi:hypothetical protein
MAWATGNNTAWPDAWVAVLETMHPKGYSASAIATQINASFRGANLSRNAVIGKIGRLGLERDEVHNKRNRALGRDAARARGRVAARVKRAWTAKDIKPAAPQPPAPPAPPPRIPVVHVSTITGAIIPGPSPIPPRPPVEEPAPAEGGLIDINAITARTCCWPVERDALADEWRFCGQRRDPKSGPDRERGYCTAHWRKSIGRAA